MDKPNNPPAFPTTQYGNVTPTGHDPGMTLRDWLAGQAFGAVMGGASNLDRASPEERAELFAAVATVLYDAADAMLAEREKRDA